MNGCKFIARLLDGEKMAVLCREFGISRKTGYKILTRYNEMRPGGADRPLAPALPPRQPAALPDRDADRALKQDRPSWGAPKIREKLAPALSGCAHAGDQHGACGSRSPWPGQAQNGGGVTGPRERRFPVPVSPMTCGAPTTRASSCSPIGAIAIR